MLKIIRKKPRKIKNNCIIIANARWRANKPKSLANIIWKVGRRMVMIEYFNGTSWIPAGGPFNSVWLALASLGDDNNNYRIIKKETQEVLWERQDD